MTQEQKRIITILIPLVGSHVTGEMLENAVNEICKPSGPQRGITITNIGRPSEELVDSIGNIARKFADFIIDEYIDDAAFYDLWSEFLNHNHDVYTEIDVLTQPICKPSENNGQPEEDLVNKITNILMKSDDNDDLEPELLILQRGEYHYIAKEIDELYTSLN